MSRTKSGVRSGARPLQDLHVCASQTLFTCTCSSAPCAIPGAPKESITRKHILRSGRRIASRAPLSGNLEACSLRDALILSNPRVARYPCHHRTIQRSEKRVAGCERRRSGLVVGQPEVGSADRECCSVSDNWRLVGAVRRVEFKLLRLKTESRSSTVLWV